MGTGESQGLGPEEISASKSTVGNVNVEINLTPGSSGPTSGKRSEKNPATVGQLDSRLDKTVGKIETAISEDGGKTRQEVESMVGDLASVSENMGQIAEDTGETRSVLEKKVIPVLVQTAEEVDAISENLDTTSQEVTQILELVKKQNGGILPPELAEELVTKKDLGDAIKKFKIEIPPELQSTLQETNDTLKKVESTQDAQSGAIIDIGRTQDEQTETLGRIESKITDLSQESQDLKDKIDQLNQQITTAEGENRKQLIAQAEQSRLQFEALTAQIKSLEAQKVVSQRADILRLNPGLREIAKKDAVFGLKLGLAIARIEAGEDVGAVVQDVMKDAKEHDPQEIINRATANAKNVGNMDVSGDLITLAGLETENPELSDTIRATTLDALTTEMLIKDLSPEEVTRTIVDMASSGAIDQAMALDVLNNYRDSSITSARKLIGRYDTGDIPSIEQLQKAAELLPPSSLARSMIEQRISQDQEMIDWNKNPQTMEEQIEHVVETLPEPQKTIHKNILESAQNQQKLKRETLAAETKAIEAEENARKQAEIEKTLRKLWIIARVGGPILTLALLGAAGGVGFGAVAGSLGVGASGVLIGGAIGAGAGVLIGGRYGFEHDFADWRKLNTLSARSTANIAKLRENAGALEGQIDVGELNVANLVAETAIQQEIQKRGLRSQADIQALRNQMLTQLGADSAQQKGLRQATAAIFSMRTA